MWVKIAKIASSRAGEGRVVLSLGGSGLNGAGWHLGCTIVRFPGEEHLLQQGVEDTEY